MLQEDAYCVADAFSASVPAPDDAAAMTGWAETISEPESCASIDDIC